MLSQMIRKLEHLARIYLFFFFTVQFVLNLAFSIIVVVNGADTMKSIVLFKVLISAFIFYQTIKQNKSLFYYYNLGITKKKLIAFLILTEIFHVLIWMLISILLHDINT
jgi:hypothetical protein